MGQDAGFSWRHLSVRSGILASVWKGFHPPDHTEVRQVVGTKYLLC